MGGFVGLHMLKMINFKLGIGSPLFVVNLGVGLVAASIGIYVACHAFMLLYA